MSQQGMHNKFLEKNIADITWRNGCSNGASLAHTIVSVYCVATWSEYKI